MMGGMRGMNIDMNDMMIRQITSANVLEQIGVDAALRETITFGLREIDNEQIEIQAGIQKLEQQEADMILALLENREDDGSKIAEIAQQIALNRAEIAKLPIKSLIYLRSQLTDEQLVACGVNPGMIRLSVGCENIEDILEDLQKGLDAM